jgi:hypothetical protein
MWSSWKAKRYQVESIAQTEFGLSLHSLLTMYITTSSSSMLRISSQPDNSAQLLSWGKYQPRTGPDRAGIFIFRRIGYQSSAW